MRLNPDVFYLMPFFNTKDAGPAGVDKGKGGKYLEIVRPAS